MNDIIPTQDAGITASNIIPEMAPETIPAISPVATSAPKPVIPPISDSESTPSEPEELSPDGWQVVRGEFFAHLFEPSVTLNGEKVSVNTALIRKLPNTEYVQFLVNPIEKKLGVKPCTEEDKDSLRWVTIQADGNRRPKSISCRIFFGKVMNLMGWHPNFRYQIIGKPVRSNGETVYVFDLKSAKTYRKSSGKGDNSSRKALFPEDWMDQFGVPVTEHQNTVLLNIFEDNVVFKIDRE